jgi:hypothetical protein
MNLAGAIYRKESSATPPAALAKRLGRAPRLRPVRGQPSGRPASGRFTQIPIQATPGAPQREADRPRTATVQPRPAGRSGPWLPGRGARACSRYPISARRFVGQAGALSCPVPEARRPGRTLGAWRPELLPYFGADRVSSGPTEAINLLITVPGRSLAVYGPVPNGTDGTAAAAPILRGLRQDQDCAQLLRKDVRRSRAQRPEASWRPGLNPGHRGGRDRKRGRASSARPCARRRPRTRAPPPGRGRQGRPPPS